MITYNEKTKIFHLQTPNTSYVFRLKGEYMLEHLYYGKRLNSLKGFEYVKYKNSVFSSVNYEGEGISGDAIPQEYAFFGSCDWRKPSFHAQYDDGSRITKMKYESHKIYGGKPKLEGLPATYTEEDSEAQTLEITVKDELTGLSLVYRYTAFSDHDAIARSVTARNEGKGRVNIQAIMSMNIDFVRSDFDMIHLWGAWARERYIERTTLLKGTNRVESRRGASSHHHSPFFALVNKNTTEDAGDAYGFSLVYSGNFELGAEVDTYNHTRAFMGINSFDFNWLLEPGQSFTAPETVMVYSAKGIGEMSRTYHKLYRTRLARGKWRDKERPILINNWEATYFDFNEEKILDIAKVAKTVGIELMVLDDGWFGHRNDDTTSLGDWYVDKNKLPGGIKSLGEKIEALGMKFGLWFEPEMISPDSDLYRAHPDWCLHVKDRGRSLGRNQLILDLSREDVCEYIISFMTEILESAPISYVKWDMNRNMTEVGSALLPSERQAEVSHRYMLNLYRILETMIQKFPDVLFEGCSGGGGRFDAGMMHYFNQYWTSDDSDAVERLYIQHGTSIVMPSVFMGAHVSAVPNHQTGRTTTMELRGQVAMCGQFGYELDITKMSEDELKEIALQIEAYKEIRDTIQKGNMYRLSSPFEDDAAVWQYVSEDEDTAVLCCFSLVQHPGLYLTNVKLQGLSADENYRLKGTDLVYSGEILMNLGVPYPNNENEKGNIMIFVREK